MKKLSAKQQEVAKVLGRKRVKEYKGMIDHLVPCIYAAIAIALHEEGWGYKRLNRVFARSQEIWNYYCETPKDMTELCYEQTGIDVMNKEVY